MKLFLTACLSSFGVALMALLLGLLWGFLLTTATIYGPKPLQQLAKLFTLLFRGIPELLLLFIVYYGGNALLKMGLPNLNWELSPFIAGALGLSLSFAAYATQVLGAALSALPQGQWESGLALGFSGRHILQQLILPQIWRLALPGIGNLWQILLKDTALVSVLGLAELMQWAKLEATLTRSPFLYFLLAAGVYAVASLLSEYSLHRQQMAWQHRQAPLN